MGQSILIKDLYKKYGSLNVLNGINLLIKENEIFGLLGPNGAGKSTLISIITGLVKQTSGNVIINGEDTSKNIQEVKKKIGVALQKDSFYDSLTVQENIEYFGSLYGINKRTLQERSARLLEMFSLSEKRNVAAIKLSGGMRKKLNIICSLIHNPDILILDEPMAGLDPVSKRNLREIIMKINQNKTTVIIASHLMKDVEALCNRVAIIVSGKVITQGELYELKRFIMMAILRITVDYRALKQVKTILYGNKIEFETIDNVVMIRTKDPDKTYGMVRMLIGQYITFAETVLPSIEDVFLYFVGKEYD